MEIHLIEPKKISCGLTTGWWRYCDSGFYIFEEHGPDFRLAIIESGRFVFELVRVSEFNSIKQVRFFYYTKNGTSASTFSEIMDLLFGSYPDVAEYFLFHIDELRR